MTNKELIIKECKKNGFSRHQTAYVLATVEHETANTFKPVREAFWLSEDWRQRNLRYYPYYGRGFVQLTWEENYKKFQDLTGKPLVGFPDLALDAALSAFILVYGFKHGSFTGKKITDYINDQKVDFARSRKCINGMDKASVIEKLAVKHLADLPIPEPMVVVEPVQDTSRQSVSRAIHLLTVVRSEVDAVIEELKEIEG